MAVQGVSNMTSQLAYRHSNDILLRHSKSNIAKGTIPREISHLPKGLFATIYVPE